MAQYVAEILWQRGAQDFLSNRYCRRHVIRFDGGVEVPGSSSPHVVPVPLSDPSAVDPEEAFVASLSSCHMLWFLSIAAKRGFCVDRYLDKGKPRSMDYYSAPDEAMESVSEMAPWARLALEAALTARQPKGKHLSKVVVKTTRD